MLFLGTICTIESYDQLSRIVMWIDAIDHIVAIFIADQRNPVRFIAVKAEVHFRKRVFDQFACRAGKRCRAALKYTAWALGIEIGRASCREECVSTCRSRWSPSP